jgi:hypothetical protein
MENRFIQKIGDKEFVKYEGLLNEAHERGLMSIDVEILQFPNDSNKHTCIVKAKVQSMDLETFDNKPQYNTFSDIGDANPDNTGSMVKRHLIRMASTRAKARAMRDLCNIGMTCAEEMDTSAQAESKAEEPVVTKEEVCAKLTACKHIKCLENTYKKYIGKFQGEERTEIIFVKDECKIKLTEGDNV